MQFKTTQGVAACEGPIVETNEYLITKTLYGLYKY